ncbi:phage tail protein, partial [Escherichia coli]
MSDVSTNLYKSQLLDYYYQRRAESSINKGSRFLISKAVFGTSSLVTKKG